MTSTSAIIGSEKSLLVKSSERDTIVPVPDDAASSSVVSSVAVVRDRHGKDIFVVKNVSRLLRMISSKNHRTIMTRHDVILYWLSFEL